MNTEIVTLEDLWPGDIILARRPGGYGEAPHRFVGAEEQVDGNVHGEISTLDRESSFKFVAAWGDEVERVI